MDQLLVFLRQRDVDEATIEKIEENKIDPFVILKMDETDLTEYFPAYGDRLHIKHFCRNHTSKGERNTRKELAMKSLRKKLGMRQKRTHDSSNDDNDESQDDVSDKTLSRFGNTNATKTKRCIEMGWLQKDSVTDDCKQVRKKTGGGTRKLSVPKNTTKSGLVEVGKSLFFPGGVSRFGDITDFSFDIKDFQQNTLDEKETIGDMYERTKFTILRFYLVTNDNEDMPKITAARKRAKTYHKPEQVEQMLEMHSNNTQSKQRLHIPMTLSAVSSSTASRVDQISLPRISDAQHQNAEKIVELDGKADVPPPENIPRTFMHNTTGNEWTIDAPYTSTRAVSPGTSISPSATDISTNLVSLDNLLDTSTQFALDDMWGEDSVVSFAPFHQSSGSLETTLPFEDVVADTPPSPPCDELLVRRGYALNDMIDAFEKNASLGQEGILFVKRLLPNGDVEIADDVGGVLRDTLSEFWEEFYNKCTLGSKAKVPYLRHDFTHRKWNAIAKIIAVGFQQCGYFPIQLAPCFVHQTCVGASEVVPSQDSLMEDFLNYVGDSERAVMKEALNSFESVDKDELLDILEEHKSRRIPTEENMKQTIVEMAEKELIQYPKFVIDIWSPCFQKLHMNKTMFDNLYKAATPTSRKVLGMLEFPTGMSENQQEIGKYVKKLVKELEEDVFAFCNRGRYHLHKYN